MYQKKMVFGLLLLSVALAGTAGAAGNKVDAGEQRQLVNRAEHGRQEVERKGDTLVREANVKLAGAEYMAACGLYRKAKQEFQKFNSPYFAKRIAFCDSQIARCYFEQAEQAINTADARSRQGDFETAIKLCKEALKYCPEQAERLENLISLYEQRKSQAAVRDSVSTENLLPGKKDQDYQIEVLLEQGRKLVAANELGEAARKYQEIMLIDPYNAAAIKSLEGVYRRIGKLGVDRYKATHRRMLSEVEWKFAAPVVPESDPNRATTNLIAGAPKNKVGRESDAITEKLNKIIIKEFSFDDIPISVVVNHLRELSKQNDPANVGINFVYLAKNVERFDAPPAAAEGAPGVPGAPAAPGADGAIPADPALVDSNAAPGALPQGAQTGLDGAAAAEPPPEKTVNFSLKDSSVMDILRKFKTEFGVRYKITKDYVVIAPEGVSLGDMETRVFNVEIKDFESNESLRERLIGYGIPYGPGSSILYDKNIRCVYATNTSDNLDATEKFLEEEYNTSDPMIQIMLRVVEISQKDINELSFNWQYSVNANSKTTNANGDLKRTTTIAESNQLLRYYVPDDAGQRDLASAVADSNLSYVWENSDGTKLIANMFALNWADSGDVLYSPRVTVMHNQVAHVAMVTLRYFPEDWELIDITESSGEESGWVMLDASPQPTLENEHTLGFQFTVQPKVLSGDGNVIEVKLNFPIETFSDWMVFDARTKSGDGESSDEDGEYYKMPIFDRREINTLVRVADGDTVLVGGVSTDITTTYSDKIPILGDLPLIGRLFQSRYTDAQKGNMLIFMTCRIVNPDGSAKYPEGRRPNGIVNFGRNR